MFLQPDPAVAENRSLQIGRRGEEPLRQLANTLDDVFWIYEPHCVRFYYVSPAYERDWMRSADALYADAREWFAPVHDDDRPMLQAAFDRLAFGEGYAIEYREITSSGSHRWISERAIRGAEVCGQPLRFAGVSHDITVRKNAESVIERQVEHMGRLIETLLDVSRISVRAPGAGAAVAPVAATPHRRKRVLLVDHNRDTAESLQALLEMEGHTVAVAFTGQAALEQAAQLRPEIVILDVGLPDISGYDVARRLREDTRLPASLLVAMTGMERDQERHASLQAGFDHHVAKPTRPAVLLDLVGMNVRSATSAAA